jgi:hypothetical protein
MSLNLNPLKYLEDIIFFDGLETIMASFLNNQNLLEEGYTYHEQIGTYDKFELHEFDDSNNPSMTVTTIDKNIFLEQYLDDCKKMLFQLLKEKDTESTFSAALVKVYNDLNGLIKKQSYSDSNYNDIIELHLIKLVEDLRIKFPIIESHKVFRVLNNTNGFISYFQFKDLKASFFEELYEVTYKLELIDDIEVLEETFYDVLTSSKPNPEQRIIFITKNHLIAHYLKEIEPFFNNLNAVTIEKSKCFYNKQGKPITCADLYTSLSRNKDKDLDYIKKIKHNIHILQKAYLK